MMEYEPHDEADFVEAELRHVAAEQALKQTISILEEERDAARKEKGVEVK